MKSFLKDSLITMLVIIIVSAISSSLTTYILFRSLVKQFPKEIFNFKEVIEKNQMMNKEEEVLNILLKNFNKEKNYNKK